MMKMVFTLLNHSRQAFWRSKTLDRSLTTAIFTWFMMGLIMLYALGLGIMLGNLLSKIDPDINPVSMLNSWLIFYWVVELILRLLWQRNITLNIQYYLTQRISRAALTHFMLIKSWVNLFLLLVLFLFTPFAISKVAAIYDPATAWVWFGFIFLVSFLLHHLVIAIQQFTKGSVLLPLLLGLGLIGVIYLNSMGFLNLTSISESLMAFVLRFPFILFVPVGLIGALYFYDFKLVKENLSLDALPQSSAQAGIGISRWVSYLNSFGAIGQLMALELRLIWRNKRPRALVLMSFVMLVYFGFFLVRMHETPMIGAFILISTGMIMLNYGQLLFSWESSYFDFLMTRNFSNKTYLVSKFILFFCFNTLSMVIVGGVFAFINIIMVKDLVIWYLMNSGFFAYIFIGGTMLGPKPLDVNARAMFNYEGMNIFQFLIIIPYVLVPIGISIMFKSFLGETWRDIILLFVGFLGILFYQQISGLLAKGFTKRKYKILDGFRE